MISFFHTILYEPLFNALIFLYNNIPGHDFGIAIILLTVVVRLVLFPLNSKAIRSQKELSVLQPKIKEIQEKFKGDKAAQSKELMKLYKEHGVNPMGGCLPMLIQFPVLIALYWVFINGLNPDKINGLYSFIAHPGTINPLFLGILDLSKSSGVLAILAGISQFIQTKMMIKVKPKQNKNPGDFSSMMSWQMTYFMPMFIVFIAWKFPAGLALYWVVTNIFSIGQQYFINRKPLKLNHTHNHQEA